MGRLENQEQYEEYIAKVNPAAMAIGRKVPYHLEYLRRHGAAGPLRLKEVVRRGKGGRMDT